MKNKKVLIISIVVVVLLILFVGLGIAFVYLTTDIFKTNDQLFAKYFSQFGEVLKEFEEQELNTYFEKQNSTPYENSGKLSFNVKIPDYENVLRYTNSLNISFNGKTDNANNKKEQHFQINYSDTVNFPFDYKHTGNLYALASNIVANKYVAVRNDSLPETFVKIGLNPMEFGEIPDKIEPINEEAMLSREELNSVFTKYYNIIKANLKESNFSKINNNSFALTLSKEELKVICIDLLQQLKNDDSVLNIINSSTKEELQKQIEQAIVELQEIEANSEQALKIVIHQIDGKLTKIEVNLPDVDITIQILGTKIIIHVINAESEALPVLTIEKVKQENEISYIISYKVEETNSTTEAYFNAKYSDLSTQSVKENYVFGISNISTNTENQELTETKYEYTLNTTKTFSNEIVIEDLNEKNALILNDQDITYVRSTMGALGTKIAQLNKSQMEKLGLRENENPLIMATPFASIFLLANDITIQGQENSQLNGEEDQMNNLQSMLVQATNKEFEQYKGNEVKGSQVKALLQLISNTITQKEGQIVRITYNDQNLTPSVDIIKNVRNVINTAATYDVSFGYSNTTGMIDTINIKVNTDSIVVRNPVSNEVDNNNTLDNSVSNLVGNITQ